MANSLDDYFEDYLLSNEYDRFESYLLSIVRDAFRMGFLAGLNAAENGTRPPVLPQKKDQ
ncbi:MAG TPA: hypothetical protein PKB13_02850 [Clostridia bacterium]|jgi:hypothetical protein|nr:hypothetical protein [Clostridia bacterium]